MRLNHARYSVITFEQNHIKEIFCPNVYIGYILTWLRWRLFKLQGRQQRSHFGHSFLLSIYLKNNISRIIRPVNKWYRCQWWTTAEDLWIGGNERRLRLVIKWIQITMWMQKIIPDPWKTSSPITSLNLKQHQLQLKSTHPFANGPYFETLQSILVLDLQWMCLLPNDQSYWRSVRGFYLYISTYSFFPRTRTI